MRKIVVSMFLSLDGVMEAPEWTMPYWNDRIAKIKEDELVASHAMLLGRVTYEEFADAWPDAEDEFATLMNSTRKYVVSTTLTDAKWQNSQVISGDVIAEIKRLKSEGDNDLLVVGSATLIETLMAHNLVDEYTLLLYPVVLGKGKRLFRDDSMATLELGDVKDVGSGVVMLSYRPKAAT